MTKKAKQKEKMTNELEILKSVDEDSKITQRELAKRTGLSLGSVNVLLKRLINKGLVKMEHISARTIKYILTPKGMIEKARLTYKYIVSSYNHIANIENKLLDILDREKDTRKIILYGNKDELYDIITSKLNAMDEHYQTVEKEGCLGAYTSDKYIIIAWHPEDIENLNCGHLSVVNVLE